MRIGFVTDEISSNIDEAITLGIAWGIHDYELRMIGSQRVPNISPVEVQRILSLQRRHALRFTALSPGVFKGTMQDDTLLQHELREVLPQTFQLARLFNTPTVIVFGFRRAAHDTEKDAERIIQVFRLAAEAARQHGLTLAVENEPGFWCDTGVNTAQVLTHVNSPNLRANWDPGNAIGTSEAPYPQGYEALKNWIGNVHVKDTVKGALVECVPLGAGKVDWRGQLQALMHDKIIAHITIETHCQPLIENSRKNLEYVRGILAAAPPQPV